MTKDEVDRMIVELRLSRNAVFGCHLEELQCAITDWMDEVADCLCKICDAVAEKDGDSE